MYTHKKGMPILTLIFMKLTNAEPHYVQIPYTAFLPTSGNKLGKYRYELIDTYW